MDCSLFSQSVKLFASSTSSFKIKVMSILLYKPHLLPLHGEGVQKFQFGNQVGAGYGPGQFRIWKCTQKSCTEGLGHLLMVINFTLKN